MLFCEKARTGELVPPAETADPDRIPADSTDRPNIAHSGRIRLGGGCRLPLQGEPMERDRPWRRIPGQGV